MRHRIDIFLISSTVSSRLRDAGVTFLETQRHALYKVIHKRLLRQPSKIAPSKMDNGVGVKVFGKEINGILFNITSHARVE